MATETVRLSGHIIDSLILAKVLDTIVMLGGTFDLLEVKIGKTREDASHVNIQVHAETSERLEEIIEAIQPHGRMSNANSIVQFNRLQPMESSLNHSMRQGHLPTQVRINGNWIEVEGTEMDLAIAVREEDQTARMVPMADVKKGDRIVTGSDGVRVLPLERPEERDVFGFMEAQVSSERPYRPVIGDIARRMLGIARERRDRKSLQKVLLAGGPAIVHAGGREALAWLINAGYIHVLFLWECSCGS